MINDKEQLGQMVVDILMQLDKVSAEKVQKDALTYTQKMMKRVNAEIQSGLKRGFTTAVGGILGGDAGMLVGAMMGGGAGAALGVAAGYAIDYAVKKVMAKYKSEAFFKNIDPYVKKDYGDISSVKGNLKDVDTKEAFIISELSKIFKTDPATLSRQIAISQQYKGFAGLEGGSSAEKMFNFLGSISGMSPVDQIRIAKQYGITSGNIPSLKQGMGGVENTLLSGFNKEDFDRYIQYLEGYSGLQKDYGAFEKEMAIKARKGLDYESLIDETSAYSKTFKEGKKILEKGVTGGLGQQYAFGLGLPSEADIKMRELQNQDAILGVLNDINNNITSRFPENKYAIEEGKKSKNYDDVIKVRY